jgi:hypothetical protein
MKLKIANYNVQLESKHSLIQTYSKNESLKIVGRVPRNIVNAPNNTSNAPSRELMRSALKDYLELSKEATEKLKQQISTSANQEINVEDIKDLDIPDKDKQKILLLAKMIKALTGKDIKITIPKEIKIKPLDIKLPAIGTQATTGTQAPANTGPNWAIQYHSSESYSESESLSFAAKGMINTTDGKQIQFDLKLNMSRQFASQNNVDITMGNKALLDPLVINFDGPAAKVTQTKFEFDIDSDGKADQLSTLTKGSGFLALDANNDGVINDGNELFGTKSGNGFADLSAFDTDKNNWIDENDVVFDKLRVFTVYEDGTRDLFTLGEKGIGAIYLGNVGAAFNMTDTNNNLEAQAKSAGIFLKENGTAGTVQQVDFVV